MGVGVCVCVCQCARACVCVCVCVCVQCHEVTQMPFGTVFGIIYSGIGLCLQAMLQVFKEIENWLFTPNEDSGYSGETCSNLSKMHSLVSDDRCLNKCKIWCRHGATSLQCMYNSVIYTRKLANHNHCCCVLFRRRIVQKYGALLGVDRRLKKNVFSLFDYFFFIMI